MLAALPDEGPRAGDVAAVNRPGGRGDAFARPTDLITPHHPPLDLRAREPGAHRKISRFLQKEGRP